MEGKDFAKGAMLGVAVGVLSGVLFAPKSGEKTREGVTKSLKEMKDKVLGEMQNISDFSREAYDRIVGETVASYKAAKKITPDDAKMISEIFEKSFADIEKILEKDAKKIAEPQKKK